MLALYQKISPLSNIPSVILKERIGEKDQEKTRKENRIGERRTEEKGGGEIELRRRREKERTE